MARRNPYDWKLPPGANGHSGRAKDRVRFAGRYLTSPLMGMTAPVWFGLLRTVGWKIAPRYLLRAWLAGSYAVGNTALAVWRRHSVGLIAGPMPDPVFILGHWRSGTTLLQELLALSPALIAPTTVQVFYPNLPPAMERFAGRLMDAALPPSRVIDQMEIRADSPQEEEFAMAQITGRSPYLTHSFPERRDHFERYLDFRSVDDAETRAWFDEYDHFVRAIWRGGAARPLLKSPASTARVGLLHERYPQARFIHISRSPYDVVRSTITALTRGLPFTQFQPFKDGVLEEIVLGRFAAMYDSYLQAAPGLPDGSLLEIRYDDLRHSMAATCEAVFGFLDLPVDVSFRARLHREEEARSHFVPNSHAALAPHLVAWIDDALDPYFDHFGYDRASSQNEASKPIAH